MLARMDPNSLAEELPSLYRAILDRVADLEVAGRRADAARLRTSATQTYSRAWDERARRRLTDLLARNSPPVAFCTAATIFAATASISASVSVLSRGCSVTSIASDFLPSGTP